jgi:putative nucleotidyltransferase with HDIG domain
LFPPDPTIAISGTPNPTDRDVWLGIVFWTLVTLGASALPVRMTRGSTVGVSIAPILAATLLGGPAVGGWVAAIGTTEWREIRGRVPWYGSLTNHAVLVIPAISGGVVMKALLSASPSKDVAGPYGFATFLVGAAVFAALNVVLVSGALSIRTRQPFRAVLVGDINEITASQLALAPVAWLMAVTYRIGPWAAALFAVPLYTTRLSYRRFVEMREMFTQTISSLAQAVDKRDKFTSGHSLRVKEIAVDIGRELRCSDSELEALEWGGLLHDVGKIGVPDAVLLKQERLTKEERMVMNSHPVLGAEIIAPVTKLAPELPIIRHHHEWYNGSGYPDRLMGDEIPRLARILHVADAFEAMTAARPYRMKPLTAEQALGELRKFAGIQFDPVVVEAFTKTKWVEGAADPGRPESRRPVPLISQAASRMARSTALTDQTSTPPDLH